MSNIKSSLPAIVVFLSTLFIAACDSEDGGSNGNTPQLNPGGTADAPTQMSFDISNEIKADSSENYFKDTVSKGDMIVINSTLINPLDTSEDVACQLGSYFISSSSGYRACHVHARGTYLSDGDRTYHFQLPSGNYGYFDAAIIPAGATFNTSPDATGRPDDPRSMILGGIDNPLSANSFYNNFIYDAQAGETLQIQTYPDVLPSGIDNARCQLSEQTFGSYYSYGVNIGYSNQFNCSETFEYQFDQAGQYNLNIRFLYGVEGYFQAVVF